MFHKYVWDNIINIMSSVFMINIIILNAFLCELKNIFPTFWASLNLIFGAFKVGMVLENFTTT